MRKYSPAAAERRIGRVLGGKWRVDALLGASATSAVYSATHAGGGRAAIKVIQSGHLDSGSEASSATSLERLLDEAWMASSIDHPSIVKIFDDGVAEDGSAYLVMELLEGETLEQRRQRRGGRLPLDEALAIGDRLMDALVAVHDAGVIHRDLKPQNVFVTHDGRIKLLDFGLAQSSETLATDGQGVSQRIVGTPPFMPPEQALGMVHRMDAQSDIWALGATLFFLLSGQAVHPERRRSELVLASASTPPRSLGIVVPEVPHPIVEVIDTALRYKKAERWPDVRSMRTAWKRAYPDNLPTFPPAPLGSIDPAFMEATLVLPTPFTAVGPAFAVPRDEERATPLPEGPSSGGGVTASPRRTKRAVPLVKAFAVGVIAASAIGVVMVNRGMFRAAPATQTALPRPPPEVAFWPQLAIPERPTAALYASDDAGIDPASATPEP